MPKPTVIDPGDRGMVNQATGKPIYENPTQNDKQGTPTQPVLPTAQPAQTYVPQQIPIQRRRQQAPAPSISTASMLKPLSFMYPKSDNGMSYWDKVQQYDADVVKSLDEQLQGEPLLSPSFMSSNVSLEPTPEGNIVTASGSHGDFDPISMSDLRDSVNESILKPLGHDLDHEAGLDVWESESADRQGRDVRTSNMWGEEYDLDGSGLGWLDNQLDYVGNTPTNDVYVRDLIDSGALTEDQAYALTHRPHQWDWMQDYNDDGEASFYTDNADLFAKPEDVVLDDGTPNYHQLTADEMTGTQYRHYRDDLGMGGRDDIDLTRTYSKSEEANKYGFIPFIPDTETYGSMAATRWFHKPYEIGRKVANARTLYLTPDYQMSFDDDGERKSMSGREFESSAPSFMNEFYHDREYSPEKYMTPPEDDENYTALVSQVEVPDIDGNSTYHYGHLVDVYPMGNDTYQLSFTDGSSVLTDRDYIDSVRTENGSIDLGKAERVPIDSVGNIVSLDNFGPQKHRAMINEAVIPDEYGNDTYHYFEFPGKDDNFVPYEVEYGPNGTYKFTFMDGTSVNAPKEWFDTVYDYENQRISIPWNRVWIDDRMDGKNTIYDKDGNDIAYEEPEEEPTLDSSDVVYYPDLVMSDGTRLSLDDVERLWMDKTPEDDDDMVNPKTGEVIFSDDDIDYKFGTMTDQIRDKVPIVGNVIGNALENTPLAFTPLGLVANNVTSRPSRLGGQEVFTEDGADWSNIMNNVTDWTLGSLPISLGAIAPWAYSTSGAVRSLTGTDPNSYNPADDSSGLIMGGWDDEGNLRYGKFDKDKDGNAIRDDDYSNEVMFSNFAGNEAVPFTEMLVGPVGEHIIPLDPLVSKLPIKSATGRLLAEKAAGAGGEAFEEILGNPFEDFTQYGLSGLYSTPNVDEVTGEPVTDMYGHEDRRRNDPAWVRADNAMDVNDNANAALGGALVSAMMDMFMPGIHPGHPISTVAHPIRNNLVPGAGVSSDLYNAIMQDRARHATGTNLYVDPEDVERQDLGAEYANLIDSKGMIRKEQAK